MPPAPAGEHHCLCAPCRARLPRTNYHRLPDNSMEMRFAGCFPFRRAAGHFFYSSGSDLSQLMQDLKYRRFRQLARYLGEMMGNELSSSDFLSGVDLIVPIPMHFLKKARRGYNQTEEIAKGLSKATGIEIAKALRARRPHRTQTALSLDDRRKNLNNVFALLPGCDLHGKHILLLDDVCTTGATLIEAGCTISNSSPCTEISILTIGVTF